jgi:Skp family chaperone for outer membrane proteins
MRHSAIVLLLSGIAVSAMGCGQMSSTPRGGIAVVDLVKVAAETGRGRILSESLDLKKNALNEVYRQKLNEAKTKLEAQKKKFGEEPTDEQKTQLSQFERNAITVLNQLQSNVNVDYQKYEQEQMYSFRSEVKPVAQEIAAKRGMAIVIPKNEGLLLSVDPGVDITDEVIKAMREKQPVPPAASQTAAANKQKPKPGQSRTAAADEDDEAAVR